MRRLALRKGGEGWPVLASAAAICVAGWLSDLRGARAVRDAHHQVVLSRRLAAAPARDRVHRHR